MPISKSDRNRVEIVGEVAGPVRQRQFDSGARLLSFSVRVKDETAADSVPMAWWSPQWEESDLPEGTRVRVIGRVRRRFYATPAGPRSAVEVVVSSIEM